MEGQWKAVGGSAATSSWKAVEGRGRAVEGPWKGMEGRGRPVEGHGRFGCDAFLEARERLRAEEVAHLRAVARSVRRALS